MPRRLAERELTDVGPAACAPGRGTRRVTVNLAQLRLTWLHACGSLSDAQHAAGERLRADWKRAQLAPSLTMRWDPVRGGDRGGSSRAVRHPVACGLRRRGPAEAERSLEWPTRSGKLVLKLALDRLAAFYRIG